jgi:hypothetical protein
MLPVMLGLLTPQNFVSLVYSSYHMLSVGRYNDLLRAGRSGDRIPVRARIFAPVQTGPGAHPAPYTMGTVSLPGVKRPGPGVDHPPLSSAEVKETVELYLYSTSGSSWPVLGWPLPLPITHAQWLRVALWNVTTRTGSVAAFSFVNAVRAINRRRWTVLQTLAWRCQYHDSKVLSCRYVLYHEHA